MPLVLTTVNTEAQYATNVPGTTTLLEGPAAGSDNVVLTVSLEGNPWMASASTAWLHLSAANQKGSGITNVVFSFDANPGITRVSTLTIAGQTLTVTQAAPAMYQRPRCPLDYLFPDYIPPRRRCCGWRWQSLHRRHLQQCHQGVTRREQYGCTPCRFGIVRSGRRGSGQVR